MQHKRLLNYLCAQNNIPLWLVDQQGRPFYHSADKEELRPTEELQGFFAGFAEKTAEAPVLYSVGGMELYAFFAYRGGTAVAGPAFLVNPMSSGQARHHLSVDYLYTEAAAKAKILLTPGTDADSFTEYVCVLLELLQGKAYDPAQLLQSLHTISLHFILNKALAVRIFNIREEIELSPHSYEMEQRYLRCVREGDLTQLQRLPKLTVLPVKNELSADRHRQFLYEMIALLTLVTRAAITGGLDTETAYMMSDLYIRQMDEAKHTRELLRLSQNMAKDFTQKVREQKSSVAAQHNPVIQACMSDIRAQLHQQISLADLADHAGLSPKYLSRLFVKETGMTLTAFIQWERVNEAKALLAYSEHSLSDIGNYLAFSSQSYFTKVFKQHTGVTPQEYRLTFS